MIDDRLKLSEVDAIYQRMIQRELVVFPWYEEKKTYLLGTVPGTVVGLIVGWIDEMPPFIGKSAWLEHIIVLPEAKDRRRVIREMPDAIHARLEGRSDVHRILLSINHSHPKRARLDAWCRSLGYFQYGTVDETDWYLKPLTSQGWITNGKETTEACDSGADCTAGPAAPAASGS